MENFRRAKIQAKAKSCNNFLLLGSNFHRVQHRFTSDGNGEPLRTEHSHWSMFEYKKGFSLQPMREVQLWDFPTSVTGKCRSARKASFFL